MHHHIEEPRVSAGHTSKWMRAAKISSVLWAFSATQGLLAGYQQSPQLHRV